MFNFILIILLIWLFFKSKLHVDWNTIFKKRTPPPDDTGYGVWLIDGKQGSGKTYEAVRLAFQNLPYMKGVRTNIHSLDFDSTKPKYTTEQKNIFTIIKKRMCAFLSRTKKLIINAAITSRFYDYTMKKWASKTKHRRKIDFETNEEPVRSTRSKKEPEIHVEYFTKLSEIYDDTDDYYIYVIDELSKKFDKNSRCDKDFYAWLNQRRKRKSIAILITQEYKEIPMWLRRPIKFQITTKPTKFLRLFGFFTTYIGDGENPILDKDTLEWSCPIIQKRIAKRILFYSNMYDTTEPVNDL